MTDLVKIAIISATPGIVASILSYLNNRRLAVALPQLNSLQAKSDKIETLVNNHSDAQIKRIDDLQVQLSTANIAVAHHEGAAEERDRK